MSGVTKAARIGQIVIGAVYLIAGAIKTWDPVLFYWESIPYTQIIGLGKDNWETATGAAKLATVLGPIEFGLGVALILNWRPRIALPVATLLMAFFTGLMVKAWHIGASIDCGCFGALVERGPGEAAIEDAVMLAVLIFAWWGIGKQTTWPRAGQLVGGAMIAALVVGGARFFPESERLKQSDLKSGVRLTGLDPKGLDIELLQGEYLLEVFSPTCGHCMDAVPKVNSLAEDPELPQVIGLTSFPQDHPKLADFKKRLEPRYEIATISQTDFYRLTFGHGYPRLAYIKDGVVQTVWERDFMPTRSRLLEITGS